MNIRLLPSPPTSGEFLERRYGDSRFYTFAQFEKADGDRWVGVFGDSDTTEYSGAFEIEGTGVAFVVAKGQGYAVSIETGDLCFESECDYITGAYPLPGKPMVLALSMVEVIVYDSEGAAWSSDRLADDEVRVLNLERKIVELALDQHDGWYSATLHFDPFWVEPGKLITSDRNATP